LVNSRTYHNRRVRTGALVWYGRWRRRYRLIVVRFVSGKQHRVPWWQFLAAPWCLAHSDSPVASPP